MNPLKSAMLEVIVEDARAKPCLLCGAPPAAVGVWAADVATSRRLGSPPGKHKVAVYSLCAGCQADPRSTRAVEDRFLAEADLRHEVLAAGWEVDDGLASRPGRPVPDWVRDALGRLDADRAGALFAWCVDPCRAIWVRTAAGGLHAWTEGDHGPAPPPPFLVDPTPPGTWRRVTRPRRPPAPADRRRRRRE